MNWILVVAIVGLLAVAGFVVAEIVGDDEFAEDDSFSCDGDCSVGDFCSNSACGVRSGGSCGCGR